MQTGLVVISGPTGSGKNAAVMALASQAHGAAVFPEMRNADHAQRAVSAARRQPVFISCHATYAPTVPMRLRRLEVRPDVLSEVLLQSASRRRLPGTCPVCAPTGDLRNTKHPQRHRNLADVLASIAADAEIDAGDCFPLPRVVFGRSLESCLHCAGQSLRRLIVEKVSYRRMPALAFSRPEHEWWDEAVLKGDLVPLWYQAAALLLRREVSVDSFFDFFTWGPPHQEQLSPAARQRLAKWLFAEIRIT